jgi:RNA polymerase sigma factor (sigma-70 family)
MPSLQNVEIAADDVDRARAGDGEAYERLYLRLSTPLYTLLRRLVIRPAVAEDLLQDTFVEILRNLHGYRGTGSFAGWVRSIAVSKALMYLRSPWHRSLSWFGADGATTTLEETHAAPGETLGVDLERALDALPAVSRTVVWLHDVEGFTHTEIGRLFDRTPSFSKSQLARAHQQLRVWLQPESGVLECMPTSKNC